jgi:hypothetical protein
MLALSSLSPATIFSELVSLLEFSNFLFEIHSGRNYSGSKQLAAFVLNSKGSRF